MTGETEEKKKGGGWFDGIVSNLSPFRMIGTVLKTGLFAGIAFLILQSEKVQHWIGGIFGEKAEHFIHDMVTKVKALFGGKKEQGAVFEDMSWEDAKTHLKGKEQVPEAVYNIITESEATWLAFRDTIVKAHGGKGSITDLDTQITDAKSITQLMKDQPDLTVRIVNAVGIGSKSQTGITIMKSVKTMLADGSFDTLLDASHIDKTSAIMFKLIPEKMLTALKITDASQLAAFFKKDMGTTGKLSDATRKTIDGIIDGMLDDGKKQGFTKTDPSDTKTDMSTMLTQAGLVIGDKNVPLLLKLQEKLGEERFKTLAEAMLKNSPKASMLAMKSPYIDAMIDFAKASDLAAIGNDDLRINLEYMRGLAADPKMKKAMSDLADRDLNPSKVIGKCFAPVVLNVTNQDGTTSQVATPPTASAIIQRLLDPKLNAEVTKLGTDNLAIILNGYARNMLDNADVDAATAKQFADMVPLLTKNNLEALLSTTRMLANNPANKNLHPDFVLGEFTELALNGSTNPLVVNEMKWPGITAAFFQNEDNAAIFKSLLDRLKIEGPKSKLLDKFRKGYGTKDSGLLEVFADANAMQRLPDMLVGVETGTPDLADIVNSWLGSGNKLIENEDVLTSLGKTITEVNPEMVKSQMLPNDVAQNKNVRQQTTP